MRELQQVLVPVDFSEASRGALAYAAALAGRMGASLTALHVTSPYASYEQLPAFPAQAPIGPERLQRLEQELQRFVSAAGRVPAVARVVVREGDPADEILAQAADGDADLIVLGTHGRRSFERWILGSVTDRVARRADRSVLVVPPHLAAPASRRIVCALDLSDSSGRTLERAVELAAAGARLSVLYVAEGAHWYEPWPIAGVDSEALQRAVADAARERLSALVAEHVPENVPVEVSVTFGRAQREIVRVAGEGAELVVLGLPSTRGVDRFFFGSTAQHVLRAGVCPVLLVRHLEAGPHEAGERAQRPSGRAPGGG
jgi:nucleotide-binding universal stress UspA family protein